MNHQDIKIKKFNIRKQKIMRSPKKWYNVFSKKDDKYIGCGNYSFSELTVDEITNPENKYIMVSM